MLHKTRSGYRADSDDELIEKGFVPGADNARGVDNTSARGRLSIKIPPGDPSLWWARASPVEP